jgi:hypothetical protein
MKKTSSPNTHPAMLDDPALLKSCRISDGIGTGPGGQHRNRKKTAITVEHLPTGTTVTASERRKAFENKVAAIKRLRLALARSIRTKIDLKTYRPSKLWETRRAGRGLQINPAHKDYPALLAEAMDVLAAKGWDVARTAGVMGLSMSQLSKLLRHDKQAFGHVNDIREERGLPRLK